jgi:DnaJ-domain-containing protein 1
MAHVLGTGLSTTAGPCTGCGAPLVSPVVCQECGAIFEIPADAFALFGFAPSWAVDLAALERRYDLLSRAFREKSARRGEASESIDEAVRALGAARRLLFDPLERARYLLKAYGGAEREKPVRKREFQSEVMEIDQAAVKARKEGDSARLAAVVLEAEEKLASAIVAAGQSFTRLERSLVDEVNAAADALAEAQFWRLKVDELRATLGG